MLGIPAEVAGCRHAVPHTSHHAPTRTSDLLVPDHYHDLLCPCHIPDNRLLATFLYSTFILWYAHQQDTRVEPGTPSFPSNPYARVCRSRYKERSAPWECCVCQPLTTHVKLIKTDRQVSHCQATTDKSTTSQACKAAWRTAPSEVQGIRRCQQSTRNTEPVIVRVKNRVQIA